MDKKFRAKQKPTRFPRMVGGVLLGAVCLIQGMPAGAATYYVSSHTGDDLHDGLSAKTAWKSFEHVNSVVFEPGDSLLLAADSVFNAQLAPQGSGIEKNGKMVPIVIDRYGEGALPRIDGEGKVDAPVFLHNVEGWEIQNLEVTNTGLERRTNRFGILVLNDAMPVARHFVIRNVTVRDVNGALPKAHDDVVATAIRLRAAYDEESDLPGRRFEDVLVEGCFIKDCARNGILISGAASRRNWNPCTGVTVRRNVLEGVPGDGILVIGCEAPLVEWNTMRDCPDYKSRVGAAAGMWPWSCDNAVFQFNEVVGHNAWMDGQAYDCDYNCNNTVYQYNLSRDNVGGFMLICAPSFQPEGWRAGNDLNRGSIVRYNLSINDGRRLRGFKDYFSPSITITGGTVEGTELYGNLVIVPKKPDPTMDTDLIYFGDWGEQYSVDTIIRDNVFVVGPGQPGTLSVGETKRVLFKNNRFYGDVEEVVETDQVKARENQYVEDFPRSVTISGSRDELKQFAMFLEEKGNPHEQQGIALRWNIEK